jgi:hypothetical protein
MSFDEALTRMQSELRNVARRETNSKLRSWNFEGLSTFSPQQIVDELKTVCPITYKMLSEMMKLDIFAEKKIAPMALIYGVIMFKRCHELSHVQRINSIILADSGANTEVYKLTFYFFSNQCRWLKRRTFHVPNLMLMSKVLCLSSFALGSAHEKFDVWTGPCVIS